MNRLCPVGLRPVTAFRAAEKLYRWASWGASKVSDVLSLREFPSQMLGPGTPLSLPSKCLPHSATLHPYHPLLKHTHLNSKETATTMKAAVTERRSSPDFTFPKIKRQINAQAQRKFRSLKLGRKWLRNFNIPLRVSYVKTDKGRFTKDQCITSEYFFCEISPDLCGYCAVSKTAVLWRLHRGRTRCPVARGWTRLTEWAPHPRPFQCLLVIWRLHSRTPSESETCHHVPLWENRCHIVFSVASGKPKHSGPRVESSAKLCLKLGLQFLSGAKLSTHINRQQAQEQRF